MQPFWQEARPPHIAFERRAVEKRALIEEGGMSRYVDTDFIIITPAGSKDRIERNWTEYDSYLAGLVQQGTFPQRWLDEYRSKYQSWVKGEDFPESGTPIRSWPAVSPAEIKALTSAQIRTVEELAGCNEAQIQSIGMGGRSLKQRAQDWMTAQSGSGATAGQMTALRNTNAALQAQLKALQAKVEKLSSGAVVKRPVGRPRKDAAPEPYQARAAAHQDDGGDADDVDAALADAIGDARGRDEDE